MAAKKVVVVTGSSRGIGAATALEFAKAGYNLMMAGREGEQMDEYAGQARQAGAEVITSMGDLADLAYAESIVTDTEKHFGRLDVLVNNAAWREIRTMQDMTIESWDRTLRVSLTVPAFLIKWSALVMRKNGGGVAINVSSVQSSIVSGFGTAYCSAKGGMNVMTYDLAAAYARWGIRVVAICPGAIASEMTADYKDAEGKSMTETFRTMTEDTIAMKRLGRPEEMGRTMVWLASDAASYITGTTIFADGGLEHQYMPYSIKARMFPEVFK